MSQSGLAKVDIFVLLWLVKIQGVVVWKGMNPEHRGHKTTRRRSGSKPESSLFEKYKVQTTHAERTNADPQNRAPKKQK